MSELLRSSPKYVIFDFDGVLVDSLEVHVTSILDALRNMGTGFNRFELEVVIKKNVGRTFDEILSAIEIELGTVFVNRDKIRERKRRIFLQKLGNIKLLPCAFTLLDYLRSMHILIGVASFASRETLTRTLNHNAIFQYFRIIVGIDDLKGEKDKKKLYLRALKNLGAKPCEGYIVGDTPFDMEGAQEAGGIPIGISTGVYGISSLRAHGAIETFTSLCEFLSYLKPKTHGWTRVSDQ